MGKNSSRRQWAKDRIAALESEIVRLRMFLEVEERYEREASNGDAHSKPTPNTRFATSPDSLASHIKRVIQKAPVEGMNAAQLAGELEAIGYQYPGTIALKAALASELAHLAKRGHLEKVSPGFYAPVR